MSARMRRLQRLLIEWLFALGAMLNRWARRLLDLIDARCVTLHLRFSFLPGSFITSDGVITMRLTTEQFAIATLVATTASGNPATLDGEPIMTSSDELIARVERQEDGSFRVIGVSPGVAQITATADADMDEDEIRHIEASGAVEVVAPEAETLELQFGEPQQQ